MKYYYAVDKFSNGYLIDEQSYASSKDQEDRFIYVEEINNNDFDRKVEIVVDVLSKNYIKSDEDFVDLYDSFEVKRSVPAIRNNIRLYLMDVNNMAMRELYNIFKLGLLSVEQRQEVENRLSLIYETSIQICFTCDMTDSKVRVSKVTPIKDSNN